MLLRVTHYAKKMGVSRKTVYQWINKKTLPGGAKVKELGGVTFIELSSKAPRK